MINISVKSKYGLSAVLDIAMSDQDSPTKAKQIAEKRNIPPKYLEQVLLELKHAGILRSVRGAGGGYFLAKHPEDITVADIIEPLDGPCDCAGLDHDRPAVSMFWQGIESHVLGLFQVTILDLMKEEQKLRSHLVYTI